MSETRTEPRVEKPCAACGNSTYVERYDEEGLPIGRGDCPHLTEPWHVDSAWPVTEREDVTSDE